MRAEIRSEYRDVIKEALKQEWRYEITRKSHIRMIAPNNGAIVIASGSPRSQRSIKDFRADLKRAGLVLVDCSKNS